MSDFEKYMHVERWGQDEVQGIEDGDCHVFPKIDGTNASVWLEDGMIQAGSRKRHLSQVEDNHGFCRWAQSDDPTAQRLGQIVRVCPEWRFFGEWLVPHTLKTYREDTWRRFYIFDVYNRETGDIIPYDVYADVFDKYKVDYIPCIAYISSGATEKQYWKFTETNDYLMKPGEIGEGIVIKRYDFRNRFGRQVWAKMVRSEFKEANHKNFGVPVVQGVDRVEDKITAAAVTKTLVDKERAKIEVDRFLKSFDSTKVPAIQPRLLQTVFYCVVTEELWPILKKLRNPCVDFKRLRMLCVNRVKELMPDLF